MVEIKGLIEQNDQKLKQRESELITKVNEAYAKAIEAAREEFRYLEKLNPNVKPSDKQVKNILNRTMKVFKAEFDELVEPFQEAIRASYEEGLQETSQIVEMVKEKIDEVPGKM